MSVSDHYAGTTCFYCTGAVDDLAVVWWGGAHVIPDTADILSDGPGIGPGTATVALHWTCALDLAGRLQADATDAMLRFRRRHERLAAFADHPALGGAFDKMNSDPPPLEGP